MSCTLRHAVLIDGAFLIRKFQSKTGSFPTASDVQVFADSISNHEFLSGHARLRVYFYHAHPTAGTVFNPISRRRLSLSSSQVFLDHSRLLQELEQIPDFALRFGETDLTGWKVGDVALRHLIRNPRPLQADDLVPAIVQKGVDLRIGLDMARLALTHSVDAIVAVTADSDLVPAFKFARREGLRVFLCHMGHRIKRELLTHSDRIMTMDSPAHSLAKAAEDCAA
jgi:uncharacterized LabA/DUF88 family protein